MSILMLSTTYPQSLPANGNQSLGDTRGICLESRNNQPIGPNTQSNIAEGVAGRLVGSESRAVSVNKAPSRARRAAVPNGDSKLPEA